MKTYQRIARHISVSRLCLFDMNIWKKCCCVFSQVHLFRIKPKAVNIDKVLYFLFFPANHTQFSFFIRLWFYFLLQIQNSVAFSVKS